MKPSTIVLFVAIGLLAFLSVASAEPEPETPSEVAPSANKSPIPDAAPAAAAARKPMKKLTAEQKKNRRERIKARLAGMTAEERQKAKAARINRRMRKTQTTATSA